MDDSKLSELFGELRGEMRGMFEVHARTQADSLGAFSAKVDSMSTKVEHVGNALLHLQGRVAGLEKDVKSVREEARATTQRVSEHAHDDQHVFSAISGEISGLRKDVGVIARENKTALVETQKQTPVLQSVKAETERQTPVLDSLQRSAKWITFAVILGAFVGSTGAHFVEELVIKSPKHAESPLPH